MKKQSAKRRLSEFDKFMNGLEEYLITASRLAPRNAPRGKDFQGAIKEFQKMVRNIIKGDMATARRLREVVDIHTLRRLDERIKQLRGVELTREMTNVLRRTSK